MDISSEDNSDGGKLYLFMELPFHSINDLRAWSTSIKTETKDISVYENNVETGKITEHTQNILLHTRFLEQNNSSTIKRKGYGIKLSHAQYESNPLYPYQKLTDDSLTTAPFISYQWINQSHLKIKNFITMDKQEDIRLGSNLNLELYWLNETLIEKNNWFELNINYSLGTQYNAKLISILALEAKISTEEKLNLSSITTTARAVFKNRPDQNYQLDFYYKFITDETLDIGGNSGLEGFPVKYQLGNQKFYMSLEQRSFFDWYPLHLLRVGFSIFYEVGSAWETGNKPKVLQDVGFGLRFLSTKQSESNILHMDIAYPLNDDDELDSYQLFIKSKVIF